MNTNFTDQQLRQIAKNRSTPEVPSIGRMIDKTMEKLPITTRYKNVEVRCPFCGQLVGEKTVPIDDKDSIERVCNSRICRRKHEWMTASEPERLGTALMVGVGRFFIRDGKLPTLADFTPSNELKWNESSYICGPVGTGKTWALSAITCDALSQGQTSRLVNSQWFLLEVRATYGPAAKETELDILNRYARLDVLCLDDLGSGKRINGKESEAARVLMYMLIDKRYSRAQITHISSNLKPADLAGTYDDRIARRIKERCKTVVLKDKINTDKEDLVAVHAVRKNPQPVPWREAVDNM